MAFEQDRGASDPPPGLRRAIERHVTAAWTGPPVIFGRRPAVPPSGGVWLRFTVGRDRAVAVCHAPRSFGATEAQSLADRFGGLFRGHRIGAVRFGTPSVDLDGRDPNGLRVVVTLPIDNRTISVFSDARARR